MRSKTGLGLSQYLLLPALIGTMCSSVLVPNYQPLDIHGVEHGAGSSILARVKCIHQVAAQCRP